jgi:two-component system chemotaxis response regulator CheY
MYTELATMRALVVDDSTVMRRVLSGALRNADVHDVDEAANGQEAVAAVTANTYDIILMDWNMPAMSGIDAVREIRAKGVKSPIIMVTTEAEKSRIIEAIKAGAQNYVIKPFEPSTIIGKIKDTLAKG